MIIRIVKTVLITLLIICFMIFISGFGVQTTLVAVETVMPQITSVYDSIQLRGTITERGRQTVYPQGACFVAEIYVNTGDYVEAGTPLLAMEGLEGERMPAAVYSDLEKTLSDFVSNADLSSREALAEQADALLESVTASATGLMPIEAVPRRVITSPINGIVMEIAQTGEILSGMRPCVVVSDMSRLAVQAQAGESIISRLAEGMVCSVTIEAFSGEVFEGVVDSIMPYARQTGSLTAAGEIKTQVNIAFDGTGNLRPGYSAVVKIKANYESGVATLPYEAIRQDEENREYVFILEGGRAIKTYIQTGREMETLVEVTDGIAGDEIIILDPGEIVHGQRVSIQ